MDPLVAVDTAPIDDEPRPCSWIVWVRRMPGRDVALLTEAGDPDLQEPRIGGAVRLVAVRTALDDGRMLPKKWPPFLGMALVAVLIDGILAEHRLRGGPMRIMTVAATDLPLAQ